MFGLQTSILILNFILIKTSKLYSKKYFYNTETSDFILSCENKENEINKISIVYNFCKEIIKYTVKKLDNNEKIIINKNSINFRYACKDFVFAVFRTIKDSNYKYEPKFLLNREDAEYFNTFYSILASSIDFFKDLCINDLGNDVFSLVKNKKSLLLDLLNERMTWKITSDDIPLVKYINTNNLHNYNYLNCTKLLSAQNDCTIDQDQNSIFNKNETTSIDTSHYIFIIFISILSLFCGFSICLFGVWKILKRSFRRSFKKDNFKFFDSVESEMSKKTDITEKF